jgi:hypothetical protein
MIRQAGAVNASKPWRNPREVKRDEVDFCVSMRRPREGRADARVVNLSPQGFMVRTDAFFQAGEAVLIDLPVVGEIQAKVIWALGGRVGAQLATPIASDDYEQLLAAAARPRLRWPA